MPSNWKTEADLPSAYPDQSNTTFFSYLAFGGINQCIVTTKKHNNNAIRQEISFLDGTGLQYRVGAGGDAWAPWHTHATTADLALKANVPQAIPGGADLDNYVTPGDFYCPGGGESALHKPQNEASSYSFSLAVRRNGAWGGTGVAQEWKSYAKNDTWTRVLNQSKWSDWELLATATSPLEYDLSLADGITTKLPSVYRRNQFAEATYTLFAGASVNIIAGVIIANLPEGFRPPAGRAVMFECGAIDTGGMRYGGNTITVQPDGAMVYNGVTLPAGSMFWSHGSFVAS